MRTASPAMLAKLNQQYGAEPFFVVGIDWSGSGGFVFYSDKDIFDEGGGQIADGRILAIDNLESILSLDGNNTSVSINITLSDHDLNLLTLFNTTDFHLKRVVIYQTFVGLSFGDMMELFEGHIVSDVIWDDNDRTLKIGVTTQFENYEAGFSPEEGAIPNLREDLVGKAWPMVFGSVYKCPLTRITDVPSGVTTEPMGFHDYWLDWQINQIGAVVQDYYTIAQGLFAQALALAYEAVQEANANDPPTEPDYTESDAVSDQATAVLAQADQLNQKKGSLLAVLNQQLPYEKTSTYVLTDYPINLEGVFEAGGLYLMGAMRVVKHRHEALQNVAFFSFTGPYHSLVQAGITQTFDPNGTYSANQLGFLPTKKELELAGPTEIGIVSPQTGYITDLQGAVSRQVSAFRYIEAGSSIKFLGNYPVRYVANIITGSQIVHVYAHREFESYSRRMRVPKSYYKKVTVIAQSTIQAPSRFFNCSGLRLFRPLSTLLNQHWSDNELFATIQSPIGPDFQSIIRYIVQTFTLYDVDETSLATIPSFRLNFAVLELKDVLTLIKEICFQCKVAATIKNGKFHFVYLPAKNLSGVTINIEDVIEDSVSLTFTPTENIITKMVCTWRIDWSDEKQNRIVIRYNVAKYGTRTQEYDFYCFNVQKAVEASMSFWLYRKGNSWKQVKLKTTLKHLVLENYDIVMLSSELCGLYGINGGAATPAVVNNLTYNANDNNLELLLELPIKLGENAEDPLYWPSDQGFQWMGQGEVNQFFNNVVPPRTWDGVSYTPLANLEPIFIGAVGDQNNFGIPVITDIQWDNPEESLDAFNEFDFDMGTQNPPGTGNTPTPVIGDYGGTLGDYIAPQIRFATDSVAVQPSTTPSPHFPIRYGDTTPQATPSPTPTSGGAIPAQIVSGSGSTYQIKIFPNGLSKASKEVSAKCLQIASSEVIPVGTWVIAAETQTATTGGTKEYWIQPPIWV